MRVDQSPHFVRECVDVPSSKGRDAFGRFPGGKVGHVQGFRHAFRSMPTGYVTTAAGEELVFSIMVNNYPDGTGPTSVCIDPIAVLLASFAGHS